MADFTMGFAGEPLCRSMTNNENNKYYKLIDPRSICSEKSLNKINEQLIFLEPKKSQNLPRTPGTKKHLQDTDDTDDVIHHDPCPILQTTNERSFMTLRYDNANDNNNKEGILEHRSSKQVIAPDERTFTKPTKPITSEQLIDMLINETYKSFTENYIKSDPDATFSDEELQAQSVARHTKYIESMTAIMELTTDVTLPAPQQNNENNDDKYYPGADEPIEESSLLSHDIFQDVESTILTRPPPPSMEYPSNEHPQLRSNSRFLVENDEQKIIYEHQLQKLAVASTEITPSIKTSRESLLKHIYNDSVICNKKDSDLNKWQSKVSQATTCINGSKNHIPNADNTKHPIWYRPHYCEPPIPIELQDFRKHTGSSQGAPHSFESTNPVGSRYCDIPKHASTQYRPHLFEPLIPIESWYFETPKHNNNKSMSPQARLPSPEGKYYKIPPNMEYPPSKFSERNNQKVLPEGNYCKTQPKVEYPPSKFFERNNKKATITRRLRDKSTATKTEIIVDKISSSDNIITNHVEQTELCLLEPTPTTKTSSDIDALIEECNAVIQTIDHEIEHLFPCRKNTRSTPGYLSETSPINTDSDSSTFSISKVIEDGNLLSNIIENEIWTLCSPNHSSPTYQPLLSAIPTFYDRIANMKRTTVTHECIQSLEDKSGPSFATKNLTSINGLHCTILHGLHPGQPSTTKETALQHLLKKPPEKLFNNITERTNPLQVTTRYKPITEHHAISNTSPQKESLVYQSSERSHIQKQSQRHKLRTSSRFKPIL